MSDPRQVPPAPGTEPRVSEAYLRPYREEAGIYAAHRKAGTTPFTEGEIDARIMATAADLAAAGELSTRTPPIFEELIAAFWHRVFRSHNAWAGGMASSSEGTHVAKKEADLGREQERRSERRVRELASTQKRTRKPITGVTLTRPEVLLLCVIPGVVIEVFGSAPSLDAAFEIGKYLSWLFAAAISAILILAAEQLGNTLASTAAHSRRRSAVTAAFLVTVAVGSGIWAVSTLADSRATNLAYQQGGELQAPANADGSFVAPDTGEADGQAPAAEDSTLSAPLSPNYEFFVPLSVLIMSTAMLLAFRIELAHDWNELAQALAEAESDTEEAREECDEAIIRGGRAVTNEDDALSAAGAVIEREQGLLNLWLARFVAEYHRFCAKLNRQPLNLNVPPVPDIDEVLDRVTNPRGPRPAPGSRRPRPEPAQTSGNGGDPGATSEGSGGDEPDKGPAPVPPPSGRAGSSGPSRSGPSGTPRGFGSGG